MLQQKEAEKMKINETIDFKLRQKVNNAESWTMKMRNSEH